MSGRIAGHNTRFTLVLSAVKRAWLDAEARRIDAVITPSDVVRGAIAFLQAQAPHVREAVIKATKAAPEEGETPLDRG
jgi:hypothetical protein